MPNLINWLNTQDATMRHLVKHWGNINSWTFNLEGIRLMEQALIQSFEPISDTIQNLSIDFGDKIENNRLKKTELGNVIKVTKRSKAKKQILIVGHYDTVHHPESDFNSVFEVTTNKWKGPGITDMKGGLVIMLKALEAYERFKVTDDLGWTVLLTPDEEIGSPGSVGVISECSLRSQYGFVFEPCLPDGSYIQQRKGSVNISIQATGVDAHVGREFEKGQNAIVALTLFIQKVLMSKLPEGTLLNFGTFHGGSAANVVPGAAISQVNIRSHSLTDIETVLTGMKDVALFLKEKGYSIAIHQHTLRPPKLFDDSTKALFGLLQSTCGLLQQPFNGVSSGGVCDGNNMAEMGLPTIDTLGALGGGIHTPQEFLCVDSLVPKAMLFAHLLSSL